MSIATYLLLLSSAALPFAAAFPRSVEAADRYRVSGPVNHENLSIYFVHGASAPGPVPRTLREAMADGSVEVHETGTVSELLVENRGAQEVFIQAGDIVKGGKQDRVLTVSLVLPAKSGKVPIGAFCVEQGRWSARGKESAAKFASAEASVPSRDAKMAMCAPAQPSAPGGSTPVQSLAGGRIDQQRIRPAAEGANRQQRVWESVAAAQSKLSASLAAPVAAALSTSSLQLSLENENLLEARSAYVKALAAAGEKDEDIVGYVFAVNGKLNSADVYPSNGLFRKMWPKLLDASATEAIGEKDGARQAAPGTDRVLAFLAVADKAKATVSDVTVDVSRAEHDVETALYLETRRKSGGFVHRAYVAK